MRTQTHRAVQSSTWRRRAIVVLSASMAVLAGFQAAVAEAQPVEYRVLATSRTSTMEKELNEAADAGFRFDAVMGGETAFGGGEVVACLLYTSDAADDLLCV